MRKMWGYAIAVVAAVAASALGVVVGLRGYEGGVTSIPRSPTVENISVNRLRKSDQVKVYIRYDDTNGNPQVVGPMTRRLAEAELKDFRLGKHASVCSWCKPTPFSKVYDTDSPITILDDF